MDEVKKIEEVVKGLDKLPTLPNVAVRILEAVKNEDTCLKEISDILSKDPSLSAEVLKAINSPYYGLSTKVTSVPHAVNLLGISTVKSLALSFSLVKNFRSKASGAFDYSIFWKDSLIGAVAAKLLAEKLQPDFSEDAFFLGLLQNIGILTLADLMPKRYSLVTTEMENTGCTYREAENQIFGFNHMGIGEYLVKSWGLPDTFYTPIGHHHRPEKIVINRPRIQKLTQILHLSSQFIELFNSSDMSLNLGLIEHWVKTYGFEDKININEIGSVINRQIRHLFTHFDINFNADKDYDELLQAAETELANLSKELIKDLLARRGEIEELRQQVARDGMTQLINHQRFNELLEQEISRSQRYQTALSIILADIDNFKSINDNFGHPTGDKVIKAVADSLREQLRDSDHAARYGGEEFAVILPQTPLNNAIKVAERLREAIQALTVLKEGEAVTFTMSFGVADLPLKEKISREDLVKRADNALYEAKDHGRNRCCAFSGR